MNQGGVLMRYLMINKFLHPNGGSETYMFKLGEYLERTGNEVQYFGMDSDNRCVGNRVGSYTSNMDFHSGSKLKKLTYPLKTIYNSEARKKLRKVLEDFKPDICHLNNFNYQLTPSVIEEIVSWRQKENRECKILYTAHDYQLVCPNHMLYVDGHACEACLGGKFNNCTKNRCIHGSKLRSILGSFEAKYWNNKGTYEYIDHIICPSDFLKTKMDTNELFKNKTVSIHNFIANQPMTADENTNEENDSASEKYILYFGRFSDEKGFKILVDTMKKLKNIRFILAGKGPLIDIAKNADEENSNISFVGFKSGEELKALIRGAVCSIYPSIWYENCPLSVIESISLGTPVIGANIGGIPELIDDGQTGLLFDPFNENELNDKIELFWKMATAEDGVVYANYRSNCLNKKWMDAKDYTDIMMSYI